VTRVLSALEAVQYRWTIKQVLETDEAWLDDIITMRTTGEEWRSVREQDEPKADE
jgi:hypothetical protein